MELKRGSKDETPYYHFYTRSTVSGATWLKNKIKKVLGSTAEDPGSSIRSTSYPSVLSSSGAGQYQGMRDSCSSSLLLAHEKPEPKKKSSKKMSIPTLHVTPVGVLSR